MALTTEDFPQADKLSQVAMVADAVKSGQTSDHEIESFIGLASESRQGRYYRKAAELLGLITTEDNRSRLTTLGRAFVDLGSESERRDFLATALTTTELFATIGRFITENNPTESQVRDFIVGLYPGEESTARRRVSSILAYLRDANLAVLSGGRFGPGPFAGGSFIHHVSEPPLQGSGLVGNERVIAQPTADPIFDDSTYQVEVDLASHERAALTHRKLVDAKASFLQARGLPARQNRLIDLFSAGQAGIAMYEMKSLSVENFVAQMRRAVSQLYEYRYRYRVESPRMCIVTNRAPSSSEAQYVEYLQSDREMAYVWTDDFQSFRCLPSSSAILGGFAP